MTSQNLSLILRITFFITTFFFIATRAYAIPNGGSESGILSLPGQEIAHSFTISAGDSINLSISGSVAMWMEVYAPSGSKIANSPSLISLNSLSQGGSYTVIVRAYYASQTGTYNIYFTGAPNAAEYGSLTNGGVHTQSLTAGDLDSFYFDAASGDSINLNVSGDISVWMELYAPNGDNIANSASLISLNSLTQTGIYTVVMRSYYNHQTGNYNLYFTNAPGANEHGELADDDFKMGILTPADLDSYTFSIDSGDSINLSVSGDISVWMELYAPNGVNIANSASLISLNSLAQSGTYTIVIRSYYNFQSGNYDLYYTRAPGANEFGVLADNDKKTDSLSPGDLNSYTFEIDSGDSINLSVSGDISVWMELYAPNGVNIANSASLISLNSLAQSGTYTIVIRSYYNFQSGNYDLHYARAPGANEHGSLQVYETKTGTLTAGDLDSFTFTGLQGLGAALNISGDIYTWMELYAPNGANIANSSSAIAITSLPQSGTYTVVVRSYYMHQTGSYNITRTTPY